MRLILQPKYILLALALLLILIGFLTGISALPVFGDPLVGIGIGLFILLETAISFITDDYRQWRSIQYFHLISLVVMVFSVMGWIIVVRLNSYGLLDFNETIGFCVVLLFLLGQILFIVNLIAGFIRGKKVLNPIP